MSELKYELRDAVYEALKNAALEDGTELEELTRKMGGSFSMEYFDEGILVKFGSHEVSMTFDQWGA